MWTRSGRPSSDRPGNDDDTHFAAPSSGLNPAFIGAGSRRWRGLGADCGTIARPLPDVQQGPTLPRSRNTRLRPKNTSRAEARRRYRDEHRETDPDDQESVVTQEPEAPKARSAFALPDYRDDIAHLPEVFRKPLVWLPFGMLLVTFGIVAVGQGGSLPEGPVGDVAGLYVSLTLPPPPLIVFFIGGFVAPRASYIVGGLLGLFYAGLMTLAIEADWIGPGAADDTATEAAGVADIDVLQIWIIAIFFGVVAGGFASWYKRFLRSSQERARANREAREREQAEKAKEQARADKRAARELNRRK